MRIRCDLNKRSLALEWERQGIRGNSTRRVPGAQFLDSEGEALALSCRT
jgi:hypothetical protein